MFLIKTQEFTVTYTIKLDIYRGFHTLLVPVFAPFDSAWQHCISYCAGFQKLATYRRPVPYTHLTRYSPVVGAALPKPTAEAFDVANSFFLIRKIHFPYQRPVTEDPHDKRTLS